MDYGSSIQDDEHPAGASPWGSSPPASPRRQPPNYAALGAEAAYQYEDQSPSNGLANRDVNENIFGRPDTAGSAASSTEPYASQQSQFGPPLGDSRESSQHEQGINPPEQAQTSGKPVGSGAPAGQEQQARKPAYPQYKLQAKITGLERTGRKDPILRFDVHVSRGAHVAKV